MRSLCSILFFVTIFSIYIFLATYRALRHSESDKAPLSIVPVPQLEPKTSNASPPAKPANDYEKWKAYYNDDRFNRPWSFKTPQKYQSNQLNAYESVVYEPKDAGQPGGMGNHPLFDIHINFRF